MTWAEKYRPKNFSEVRGQPEAIEKIKKYLEEFNLGKITKTKKKALLLYGLPGTGKTTLAHATALENKSEIFELNASDLRNKAKLQEILDPAIKQKSLTKQSKLILVDEVDGISSVDRGGLTELLLLIEASPYPIIITANNVWNKKLSPLRQKSELIQLKEIGYGTIKDVMINILKKENKFIENETLTKIAIKSKGDLRAAINDVQTLSRIQGYPSVEIDERNKETDIFNALRSVFKNKTTNDSLKIFDSVNMPSDEVILWVEENIPTEYSGEELAKAYDFLSKADIFKGRIYKQQYWRFLVYENILLSYGISTAKHSDKISKTGFTSYKKPSRILKIWLNNQKIAKKKSISEKYAKHAHMNKKRALNEFPVIKNILKNPEIQREIKLTEEEIEYLNHSS